ncbi:MAG: YraN family protein [Actinomycetaceae bacterium]|nr:YraN family protein [Arcanobacterium sp.]MDD7504493.1 YraN family protein [Actinomycetaceae bacterium]MDY6142837.1 YraN family protein [Arcanobacterium sp.]
MKTRIDDVLSATTRSLGDWGEACARAHVRSLGWHILDQNWACQGGEIDIVAYDPERSAIVGIEVKTRRARHDLAALESVNKRKVQRLRKLLLLWMAQTNQRSEYLALDVIALSVGAEDYSITHIKDV